VKAVLLGLGRLLSLFLTNKRVQYLSLLMRPFANGLHEVSDIKAHYMLR